MVSLVSSINKCNQTEDFEMPIIFNVYYYISLCFFPVNVVANTFALYIFAKGQWRKSCMNCLLIGLSTFEILFNFCHLVYSSLIKSEIHEPLIRGSLVSIDFIFVVRSVAHVLLTSSHISRNWAVVLLAAFRFEAVCRPTTVNKIITRQRLLWVFPLVWTLCCLFSIPRVFQKGLLFCLETGQIIDYPAYFITYKWYLYFYMGAAMFFVQSGGPVVLVIFFSTCILRKMKAMNRFRRERNMHERGSSPDRMIITVCITFFLLETPSFFSKIFENFGTFHTSKFQEFDQIFSIFANLCIYLDSTINIIVYFTSNAKFREIVMHKFGIKSMTPVAI